MIIEIKKPVMSNVVTTEWQKMVTMLNQQMRGYVQMALGNDWDEDVPTIIPGSVWDTNGSYFKCDDYEGISGWDNITIGTTCWIEYEWEKNTFSFTSLSPSWDGERQGWYRESNRYFYSLYKGSDTLYQKKQRLLPTNTNTIVETPNISVSGNINVPGNISGNIGIISNSMNVTNTITATDMYASSTANVTTLNTPSLESWDGAQEINFKGNVLHNGINWIPNNYSLQSKTFNNFHGTGYTWYPPKGWYWAAAGSGDAYNEGWHMVTTNSVVNGESYVLPTFYSNGSDIYIYWENLNSSGGSQTLYYYHY